jgi:hypothetical protein
VEFSGTHGHTISPSRNSDSSRRIGEDARSEGKGKGKRYDIKGARPTGVRTGYRVIKRARKGILNTAKTPRDQENRIENQQEKVPGEGEEGGISKLG